MTKRFDLTTMPIKSGHKSQLFRGITVAKNSIRFSKVLVQESLTKEDGSLLRVAFELNQSNILYLVATNHQSGFELKDYGKDPAKKHVGFSLGSLANTLADYYGLPNKGSFKIIVGTERTEIKNEFHFECIKKPIVKEK